MARRSRAPVTPRVVAASILRGEERDLGGGELRDARRAAHDLHEARAAITRAAAESQARVATLRGRFETRATRHLDHRAPRSRTRPSRLRESRALPDEFDARQRAPSRSSAAPARARGEPCDQIGIRFGKGVLRQIHGIDPAHGVASYGQRLAARQSAPIETQPHEAIVVSVRHAIEPRSDFRRDAQLLVELAHEAGFPRLAGLALPSRELPLEREMRVRPTLRDQDPSRTLDDACGDIDLNPRRDESPAMTQRLRCGPSLSHA